MQITQLFETTVVDRQGGQEARFVILPRRAFLDTSLLPSLEVSENGSDLDGFNHLVESLANEDPRPVEIGNLIFAVATCMRGLWRDESLQLDESGRESMYFTADQIALAGVLAFSPVVPFEESPIKLDSIGALVAKASGVGLGAYVGLVVGGTSPLLFVTVPTGMIIFGAAAGVANALEAGLRERILGLIKGDRKFRRKARR